MSDEYLEPITAETEEPQNKTTKIIIAVVAAVIICVCLCLCALFLVPSLLGPYIGNVFSEIEYEMIPTLIP